MKDPVKPPRLAQYILHRFLRDDLAEEVAGDLDEKFYSTVKSGSSRKAALNYWWQVLHYMRPFALKRFSSSHTNSFSMFESYFKIGWRNILRQKGYSFLNITGLSAGMAVAILIGLWIHDEMTFNKVHDNHADIAQVVRHGTLNGETFTTSYLPYALIDEIKTNYGNRFSHVVATWLPADHVVSVENKKITLKGNFMEEQAPEMFTFRMKRGSVDGLSSPNSIFLSASAATAYFGDDDPINKLMRIDNAMDVKVTGVYEDFPHNSTFHGLEFVAPWKLFVANNQWMTTQGFTNNFLHIYVGLAPSVTFESASLDIKDAILSNVSHLKEYVAVNPQIQLHPMDKWHLYAEWDNGVNTGGAITFVKLFAIVGVFVLLLACINFMNLSTARSERRAKEVGLRKTLGSVRSQIISQFLSESFLVVILSVTISFIIVILSLTWFNEIAGKNMGIPWSNPFFWLFVFAFVLFTGLVSGSYPAFYLSSFLPVKVLKGTFHSGRYASIPRKVLVVLQFTVSVMLVVGTVTVYQQIQYAKERPVGYDREGLMMVEMTTADFTSNLNVLETELLSSGVVDYVSQSTGPTTGIWSSNGGFEWTGKPPGFQAEFATLAATPDYGKTLGWEIIYGRDFNKELASDSSSVIISESAARLMGFDEPVGEVISWTPWGNPRRNFTVVGVVKDIVMRSPFIPAMPTVFFRIGPLNWINIRISPSVSSTEAVARIERVFRKVMPTVPFDFKFAGDDYALKFQSEERIAKLAFVFAGLAIFISALGLLGLTSFVAEQRTKEIGIRKILGASVLEVWRMLSAQFVMMVLLSCIIAIPISAWYMKGWLDKYEYRMSLSWTVFAVAIGIALLVTIITVSTQALKAGFQNPAKSLRSE